MNRTINDMKISLHKESLIYINDYLIALKGSRMRSGKRYISHMLGGNRAIMSIIQMIGAFMDDLK